MSGLAELVPVAELLAAVAGTPEGAIELAVAVLNSGGGGMPRARNDLQAAARMQLVEVGVLHHDGRPNVGRAAELVSVCEILAMVSAPAPVPTDEPRLLLTAPGGAVEMADGERLETFVVDAIRQATNTLHIGGAFWNDDGFEVLNDVLIPAVSSRRVTTTIYANFPHEQRHIDVLVPRLSEICRVGPASVRWFTGTKPRMLHAKFVVRDRAHGYLGTANLTSWGMREHIEAGVELTRRQAERFIAFLEQLEDAGLFGAEHPATLRSQ